MRAVLTHPEVKGFLIAAFLFTMTPSLTSTYNFYYTVELKFDLATMSSISFVSAIGYFLSIFILNLFFNQFDFKCFYISTGSLIMILNFSSLLLIFKLISSFDISNIFFCYTMNALLVFVNELNFIPLLGICMRLCPKDLEGTTYGLFTSIFNFGYYLATVIASILLLIFGVTSNNYSHLWAVIMIQACYGLIILVSLSLIIFPRPDMVYGVDKSVYLGEFGEKVPLAPKRRPGNRGSVFTDDNGDVKESLFAVPKRRKEKELDEDLSGGSEGIEITERDKRED